MNSYTLVRDCPATLIPAGDEMVLAAGTEVEVTQALGGSVTVRTGMGLLRIAPENVGAMGEGAAARFAASTADDPADSAANDGPVDEDRVWDALRQCFDPEIPVNIVDLGLIYNLHLTGQEDGRQRVDVTMTLTAPGCGMGPTIARDAQEKIEALAGVSEARVQIVWDPQWTPHMISPAGRQKLGLD